MNRVPVILGADIELMNLIENLDRPGGSGWEASRLLLAQMPGVVPALDMGGYGHVSAATPAANYGYSGYGYGVGAGYIPPATSTGAGYVKGGGGEPVNPTDFGRKWNTTGGCCYIDSDHLEVCLPEITSAFDWVAAYYAQIMIVRDAQQRVADQLADGLAIRVFACNSDGLGNSFGSHLNFLLTRRAYSNIFEKRMQYLLTLASYVSSSVIVSGLGKVGSEKQGCSVDFQLSQRADFFEEIVSYNTMIKRPIINSRDESHCYPATGFARYHHIANDSNMCPVANLLKVGVLQILMAMVEEDVCLSPSLIFESPLDAWLAYSFDPQLRACARTIDEASLSALDHQRRVFDAASRFHETGGCDGRVPRAGEILALWAETLDMLARRDWDSLAGRLDWVLKRMMIEDVLGGNCVDWQSPEAKYLDLVYSSLQPEPGSFWLYLDGGVVDQVVSPERIEHFKSMPPDDTRAFTRGQLMRGCGDYRVEHVNWDSVGVRLNDARRSTNNVRCAPAYGRLVNVYMDTPFGSTRQDNPSLLQSDGIYRLNCEPDDKRFAVPIKTKETTKWS